MTEDLEWFCEYMRYAASFHGKELTPEVAAAMIRQELVIAEAEKYATPESRFSFKFSGASDEDLARIRACLTPFENSIVEIKGKS